MKTPMAGMSYRKIAFVMTLAAASALLALSPATAQGFSVAYDTTEFIVQPGGRFVATFTVTNLSEEFKTIRIYAGDWVRIPGQTSGYEFREDGSDEPRSFLAWMTFSPDRMELEGGEAEQVYCEVNVPDDTTLDGSYWGVIFIEAVPSGDGELPVPEEEGMQVGILTVFRYAIQVFATIEGTEVRQATFTSLDFRQEEGGFDVVAVMQNLGNIFMRPEVWLEIHDTSGAKVYEQEYVRQTVLPESAREYVFELRELPIEPGSYLVMVIADYGVPELIAAQSRIDLVAEESVPGEE